jgi:TonB family protein
VVFTPADAARVASARPAAPPAAKAAAPAPVSAEEPTVVLRSTPADVTLKAPAAKPAPKPAPSADVTIQGDAPTVRASVATATAAAAAAAAATPAPAAPRPPAGARPAGPPKAAPSPTSTARLPSPKKGPPLGLILGGVGLLLLAVLVVAGVIAYRKFGGAAETVQVVPSPPPVVAPRRPPPPAPAVTGTLRVESEPAGATITIDGQPRGTTPADIPDLALGAHEVKLELAGFAAATQSVLLSRQQPRSDVKVALARTPPATGTAEISSDPSGAIVHIGGTPVGQTPYIDARLKAGTHKVEVLKDGYEPWSGTVNVQPGKRARVDARLRALAFSAPAAATPPPVEADPNRIYVNVAPEVDTPARKTSGASASYPQRAARLKSGDSVSVYITFVVTEEGEVTDLRVVESGGRVVDEAVLSAVRQWKYSPAVRKGTPVKVRVEFKQTFRAG